jgi:hypothetical protein
VDEIVGHSCQCPAGTKGPLCETTVSDPELNGVEQYGSGAYSGYSSGSGSGSGMGFAVEGMAWDHTDIKETNNLAASSSMGVGGTGDIDEGIPSTVVTIQRVANRKGPPNVLVATRDIAADSQGATLDEIMTSLQKTGGCATRQERELTRRLLDLSQMVAYSDPDAAKNLNDERQNLQGRWYRQVSIFRQTTGLRKKVAFLEKRRLHEEMQRCSKKMKSLRFRIVVAHEEAFRRASILLRLPGCTPY